MGITTAAQIAGLSCATAVTGIRKKPLMIRYGVHDTAAVVSVIKVNDASTATSTKRASQRNRRVRSPVPRA